MKPLLILDAYCGAGGAAAGYWQALSGNAVIVGVDIKPQKRYPFHFIRGDAVAFIRQFGYLFDFIAASPPCQFASHITPDKSKHHNYIPATREALQASGAQYCIENVTGARNHLLYPIMLCGAMFPDLQVYRHRYFETSLTINTPGHSPHNDNTPRAGHKRIRADGTITYKSSKGKICVAGNAAGMDECREAMGIPWMVRRELAQAIPPRMTQYIGSQVFQQMGYRVVMPEMNAPVQLNLFSKLQAAG